jgi:ankyrin repeat protein
MSPLAEPVDNLTETLRATSLSKQDPQYRDWLEAFWIACEEGHLDGVKKQMLRGVDINTTARAGDCISKYGTGLNAAVHNKHVEVVRYLLKHGARPNQPGNPNSICLPLHIAASLGHKQMVKILLNNGANIHAQGGCYRFALTAAAVGGDISMMRLLLDQGAVLRAQDMEKETALHGAVIGGHLNAVKFLIEQGLDPNVSGDQGTALELAVNCEKQSPGFGADIIRYLSGGTIDPSPPQRQNSERPNLTVDPDAANGVEEVIDPQVHAILKTLLRASLLLSAMEGKYEDVVQLIASPDPVDPNEQCLNDEQYGYPLHAAAANGHWKVCHLLLEHGANVNAQGLTLGTALHFAVYYGHVDVAIILLAWGAEVNSVSNIENLRVTPLEMSAGMGQLACMELLLRCGAGINLTGGTAGSPLHAAASSPNSLQATQLLLNHGANVFVVNSLGLSPADIARSADNQQTKELLKQWGCPRAKLFSTQRLLAWTLSVNIRVQQQQQIQKEKAIQDLIQQYAAAITLQQTI